METYCFSKKAKRIFKNIYIISIFKSFQDSQLNSLVQRRPQTMSVCAIKARTRFVYTVQGYTTSTKAPYVQMQNERGKISPCQTCMTENDSLLQFNASVISFNCNLLSRLQMMKTTVDGRFMVFILTECGSAGGYQGLGGAYLRHFHGKTTRFL
jgi:hypothetical protein